MKLTWKHAIYLVLALAIVGIIALAWFGLNQIATAIALLFGGGAKVLHEYVKSDTNQRQRDANIEQQAQTNTQAHANQTATDQARLADQKAADDAATKAALQQQTQAGLDDAIDKAVKDANTYYDRHGEDGYVRALFCSALILLALCMMAITAPAAPPNPTRLNRAKRLLNVIKRGQRAHQALRLKYERDTKLLQSKIKRLEQLYESERQGCTDRLTALNLRTCPPCWPHGLVGAAGSLLVCGVAFGVYRAMRP